MKTADVKKRVLIIFNLMAMTAGSLTSVPGAWQQASGFLAKVEGGSEKITRLGTI
jgi:hypothetical protein